MTVHLDINCRPSLYDVFDNLKHGGFKCINTGIQCEFSWMQDGMIEVINYANNSTYTESFDYTSFDEWMTTCGLLENWYFGYIED